MADTTEKIIIEVEEKGVTETDKAMGSLNQTLEENKEANQEANQEQEEYNKTLVDSIKDTKIMGVSMNSLSASFKATTATIKNTTFGLKLFKTALAATGIGLLVVALGSLVTFFTRSQEGADKLSKALGAVGAVINVLLDRVSDFGGGLMKLFSGDITGGLSDMKESFMGIGGAIQENIDRANDYEETLIRIRDATVILTVEWAKTNQRIAQAREASNDLNNSLEDRIDFTKEALKQTEILAMSQIGLLKIEKANLENNLASSKTRSEDLQQIADLEATIIGKETARAQSSIKIRNRLQVLEKEQLKEREENWDAHLDRMAIIEGGKSQEESSRREAIITEREKQIDEIANYEYDSKEALTQGLINLQKLQTTNTTAANQFEADFIQANNEKIADSAEALFGGLAALAGQNSEFGKASAIAQAIINTWRGVGAVLADATLPTVAKVGFIAATIAQGLAAVRQIESTPLPKVQTVESVFAKGGHINGASHNSPAGGVRILAEGGEFVMNKRSMAMPGVAGLMESINSLGVNGRSTPGVFAQGGYVPSNLEQLNLEAAIQAQRPILVVEDFFSEVNSIQVTEELSSL